MIKSFAETAYTEYQRILHENGTATPRWEDLGHLKRMGWTVAAQKLLTPEETRTNGGYSKQTTNMFPAK